MKTHEYMVEILQIFNFIQKSIHILLFDYLYCYIFILYHYIIIYNYSYILYHYSIVLLLIQKFFIDGARIEAGFRKHFHRASASQKDSSCELIVAHSNVIRYYVLRLVCHKILCTEVGVS